MSSASRYGYPWLAAIAVRLAQNWLRRRGRTVRLEGASLETAKEPAASAAALSALITNERSRALWQAVAALSSGERTALILYYRDEMAVRDIARALGVTTGTVKTLLLPGTASFAQTSRHRDHLSPGVIDMTCAHVLGLIDAGPFADYPPAHLDAAWQHARECATCGPALKAAAALTTDLAALPQPGPSPELAATVLARIAHIPNRHNPLVSPRQCRR